MTIAINLTQFLSSTSKEFFTAYFVEFALSQREHQFIFITQKSIADQFNKSKNITEVISQPAANNPLMWKLWLNYTLPGIARKNNADLIIHTGGVCSLRARIKQYMLISDLSFLHFPHFFSKKERFFFKKNMPAFLNKTNHIITSSEFLAKEIIQQYHISGDKINKWQLKAGNCFQPVDWNEKETIKEKYADGREYFLLSGEILNRHNGMNVLKAFSFFKTRQKSNMQLIITASNASSSDSLIENLKTYKYRKEVHLLLGLQEKELAKITAAAYAFLYPALYEGMPLIPLQAMQCDVPVIVSKTGALNEIDPGSVLYIDPENFEDIAQNMMLVFKDEDRRAELIKNSHLFLGKNNKGKEHDFWRKLVSTPID